MGRSTGRSTGRARKTTSFDVGRTVMDYHSTTTLNEIREKSPCEEGWSKLLKHLGKNKADDEPLHLLTILESNGLDDALWCLRAKSLDRLSRHFQAWCAEQVLHHFEADRPDDERVRDQINMLRNDIATPDQRDAAAWAVAWAVAWDAALVAARDAQEKQLRLMLGEL
jgi:hypothetical protein